MTGEPIPATPPVDIGEWKKIVAEFQTPSTGRALWQIVNTLGPYALLWYLMYHSLAVSWWITVPLAMLAGAFLVRVFIIFHDCGHGSFFKSRKANDLVGFIAGILTFTPPIITGAGSTPSTTRARATWTNAARAMCGP